MRILYLGTPEFAVAPLEALAQDGRYEIVGVVTQPDRPSGRGNTLLPTPVKAAAQALGIPVIQPETLRDQVVIDQLETLHPDVGVIAAYGEILRKKALAIPPLGYVNIHPSLLPLYRGPGPVTGAILNGDAETGVSLILLDAKMDSGPILAQQRVPLAPDARAGQLTTELFQLGANMLVETLPRYAAGEITLAPQDDTQATYTRLLTRADGQIDWNIPAIQIERMTRAYDPWPGAYTFWRGHQIKIITARADTDWSGDAVPGALLERSSGVWVATGAGALALQVIQPAGKRVMNAIDWRRGLRDTTGRFGEEVVER